MLLTLALRDVRDGRQRLAAQRELVQDLIRDKCTSLLPMAQRLLLHTQGLQAGRERHLRDLLAASGEHPDEIRSDVLADLSNLKLARAGDRPGASETIGIRSQGRRRPHLDLVSVNSV